MPRKPVVLCVDDEWNGLEGRKMLLEEAACKVLNRYERSRRFATVCSPSCGFGATRLSHAWNEWGRCGRAHENSPTGCSTRSAVRR
jgi:hypothetical protein